MFVLLFLFITKAFELDEITLQTHHIISGITSTYELNTYIKQGDLRRHESPPFCINDAIICVPYVSLFNIHKETPPIVKLCGSQHLFQLSSTEKNLLLLQSTKTSKSIGTRDNMCIESFPGSITINDINLNCDAGIDLNSDTSITIKNSTITSSGTATNLISADDIIISNSNLMLGLFDIQQFSSLVVDNSTLEVKNLSISNNTGEIEIRNDSTIDVASDIDIQSNTYTMEYSNVLGRMGVSFSFLDRFRIHNSTIQSLNELHLLTSGETAEITSSYLRAYKTKFESSTDITVTNVTVACYDNLEIISKVISIEDTNFFVAFNFTLDGTNEITLNSPQVEAETLDLRTKSLLYDVLETILTYCFLTLDSDSALKGSNFEATATFNIQFQGMSQTLKFEQFNSLRTNTFEIINSGLSDQIIFIDIMTLETERFSCTAAAIDMLSFISVEQFLCPDFVITFAIGTLKIESSSFVKLDNIIVQCFFINLMNIPDFQFQNCSLSTNQLQFINLVMSNFTRFRSDAQTNEFTATQMNSIGYLNLSNM